MQVSTRVPFRKSWLARLALFGWLALAAGRGSTTAAADLKRPNVILIMADDLGFETIGANGGTSYTTPVLDELARGGVRFTQCYVQPLCTPTRVQLMTGCYNMRNYVTFGQMAPELTTFGNLLMDAGYATAIVGKWQLGRDPDLPRKFGFEEHCLWQHLRRPPRYANPGLEIQGIARDFHDGQYGPDLVNQFALDFIDRHREEPFFLYYPMMLTHSPYQATPDSSDWDPRAQGEKVNIKPRHFGEMVAYMDKLVGRVVAKLDALGIRDRTLLIFLGDNGTGRGTRSWLGHREILGGKGLTLARGMHVPLMVSWPDGIRSPRVSDELIDSTDFLPTICAAAGVTIPPERVVDGHSFLPQLQGQPDAPRRWIYSWYSPRGEPLREFAFNRDYKLYRTGELYDLRADPEERHRLDRADWPSEAALLQEALDRFADARPADLPVPRAAAAP